MCSNGVLGHNTADVASVQLVHTNVFFSAILILSSLQHVQPLKAFQGTKRLLLQTHQPSLSAPQLPSVLVQKHSLLPVYTEYNYTNCKYISNFQRR